MKRLNIGVTKKHADRRKNDTRYFSLFNNMSEGFALHEIVCDASGKPCDYIFLDINPAFERLTGLQKKNIIGKPVTEVLPSEDGYWIEQYGSVALTGESIRFSHYSTALKKHFDVFAYQPEVNQFAVVFFDSTVRKQMEDALKKSEIRFRGLYESMSSGILVQDNRGLFIDANSAALEIFGISKVDLVQKTPLDFRWHLINELGVAISSDEYPGLIALKTGMPVRGIMMGIFNPVEGQHRWIVINSEPVKNLETHDIDYVVSTFLDVTNRRNVELALRESEERFRLLTERIDRIFWFADLNPLKFTFISSAVISILGISAEDVYENPLLWVELIHPDDRERVQAVFSQWIEGKLKEYKVEYRIRRSDNQIRWIENHGITIGWANDLPQRICGILKDITTEKRIEEDNRLFNARLEQRVRERTEQLRSLAHELTSAEQQERKRLASILHDNLQQLLVAAKLGLTLSQNKTNTIDVAKSIERVSKLLDEAIMASRTLAIELSPPVLSEVGLVAALSWLCQSIQEKYGLDVELKSDGEIQTDSGGVCEILYQSVRELLFNVVKHSQAKYARIDVTQPGENHICIVVFDNGIGFDPKKIHSRPSRSGLGLYGIEKRLNLVGGRFDITSSPSQGTKIRLFTQLPMIDPTLVETSGSEKSTNSVSYDYCKISPIRNRKIRVLLVDDHQILREGLSSLLNAEEDIEVVAEAANGETAITLAKMVQPDIVIMDIHMPDISGIEVTRRIVSENPEISVIGLSNFDNEATSKSIVEAGARDFIDKAGPVNNLISSIRALFDTPKSSMNNL